MQFADPFSVRAGRRTAGSGRAVMPHSSPEPAARWFGEGVLGELVGALRAQGEL